MAREFLASLNVNSNFLITFSLIQKLCWETPNMSPYLRQKQLDFNANRSTRSYFTQKDWYNSLNFKSLLDIGPWNGIEIE